MSSEEEIEQVFPGLANSSWKISSEVVPRITASGGRYTTLSDGGGRQTSAIGLAESLKK